jgi:type I restriction enzyme R subunit
MSPGEYTEDQLVEQPSIQLFGQLGWRTASAAEEVFGPGGTLGRERPGEAVLGPRLKGSLERLNPTLPPEAITAAVDELSRDRSAMSPAAANREVYGLLKEGVKVSLPDRERGGQKEERVRVIDWQNPAANDFLLVSQLTVAGALYTRRPDLVGFVNGLPMVVIELKKPGVALREAFDGNLTCYKTDIPQLFWSNALLIASNGTDSRVGSLTADWDRFFEWKRVEREDEPPRVSLEVMLRGVCEPSRLLDLIENFTLFSEHKAGLVKILGQNHQVLGVNNAIVAALEARKSGHGRGGVFWQTQGSGKSFSMVFFAQKILRKTPGDWTFVVVTDRTELDTQIAKTFKACGAVTEGDACHAETSAQLRELLTGDHRYVFTLIHKFRTEDGRPHPALSLRPDIMVLADEAHRSQYDTLALNMRTALPNACFVAFTGTPLIATEQKTRDIFGDYVSRYDFQQSVQDRATVPLYYENRSPELKLQNPNLDEDVYALIEEAELDEQAERRLERELGRQYQVITRDERLETVAQDIVRHFLDRGFLGKAMVVCIDKATALKMHDKVRKHWNDERAKVERDLAARYGQGADTDREAELKRRLDVLKSTDMALIVSSGQNEIEQMKKLGLDIAPHRRRMNDEALDEKFKDPKDPLRLVFVCAMWLTGFDAPSCSTIYLDKPMRNHTLMQTIARANRVFPEKYCGLIVDYANVFASLEKALAIYGAGHGGANPVQDKRKLVEGLREAVVAATAFCTAHGVDAAAIEALPTGMERLTQVADAINRFISPDPLRKEFLAQERLVTALFNAVKPDPVVAEFSARARLLAVIAAEIRQRTGEGEPPDISAVMCEINDLLDRSVRSDGFRISDTSSGVVDLSAIDFEALSKRFAKPERKNIELERLKTAIRAQLDKLLRSNRTRADYLAKFQELIDSYNAGSRSADEFLKELLAFSRTLSDEEQRHVRENLSDEELTVFDILTRPGPELTREEREEVKKVAKNLLAKLTAVVVLDWRQKSQARAQVRLAIEDALDEGLPQPYTPKLYENKVAAVFEHVFEVYPG